MKSIGDLPKVLGNTKAAAMRYIHDDDDAASRASQGIGEAVGLMK